MESEELRVRSQKLGVKKEKEESTREKL